MKQQPFFSPISQSPQKEVSTKLDEKQKVETTKAENEVDEKQQVESTKAEKEVAEKQKVESTEDENYDSDDDSDDDSYDDSDDSYDKLVKSYDGPDWEQKLLHKLLPVSSRRKPKDGEWWKPFRSIPVDGLHEESDASSEELTSPQAVTGDGCKKKELEVVG
ncbi:hypothetical protein P8452_35309 [Trifolium repens]|nr:hypothetical protein P8452_35309 [Trifolium repens]